MFIENNYISSQPSFVKQFLFLAKVSISLIILETVLCTCSSWNSLNSSFLGMWITRVPTGLHRTLQYFPVQCLVQLSLLSITCDKTAHSCLPSRQINALPSSTWISYPSLTAAVLLCSISSLFSKLLLIIMFYCMVMLTRFVLSAYYLTAFKFFFAESTKTNIAE